MTRSPRTRIVPHCHALRFHRSHARLAYALLAGALLAVFALGTATAAAANGCGRQVIDDWYDNGRVDGAYDVHCYDDAIDALPRDVRDYSSAKDDIQRALQNRLDGKPAPPASRDPSPETPQVGDPPDTTDTTETEGTEGGGPGDARPGDDGGANMAASDVDTTASDSVPLPLLVLAGLALLLVAAGSAGYLVRRLQARRLPPPAA